MADPSVIKIQKKLRRRRAVRDMWPWLIWLALVVIAIFLYRSGGEFQRMNGVVSISTETIAALDTGKITDITVSVGDEVTAFETEIAKLDDSEVEARIAAAKEDVEVQILKARKDFEDQIARFTRDMVDLQADKLAAQARLGVEEKTLAEMRRYIGNRFTRDQVATKQAEVAALKAIVESDLESDLKEKQGGDGNVENRVSRSLGKPARRGNLQLLSRCSCKSARVSP